MEKVERQACPTAANKAAIKTAFFGGFEITAKPIAAIAAKKPSNKTDNPNSVFIFIISKLQHFFSQDQQSHRQP